MSQRERENIEDPEDLSEIRIAGSVARIGDYLDLAPRNKFYPYKDSKILGKYRDLRYSNAHFIFRIFEKILSMKRN